MSSSYEDIPTGLLLVVSFTAIGIGVLEAILRTRRLAPIRRALSQSRHRWLAILLPFSPAATAAFVRHFHFTIRSGSSIPLLLMGLTISTYFSAMVSGWWLALPRDAERPIRFWLAQLLGFVFWVGGGFLFIVASV